VWDGRLPWPVRGPTGGRGHAHGTTRPDGPPGPPSHRGGDRGRPGDGAASSAVDDRQGRRTPAPIHRRDGADGPGLRLLGHARQPPGEVERAPRDQACRRGALRLLLPDAPVRYPRARGPVPELRDVALTTTAWARIGPTRGCAVARPPRAGAGLPG